MDVCGALRGGLDTIGLQKIGIILFPRDHYSEHSSLEVKRRARDTIDELEGFVEEIIMGRVPSLDPEEIAPKMERYIESLFAKGEKRIAGNFSERYDAFQRAYSSW